MSSREVRVSTRRASIGSSPSSILRASIQLAETKLSSAKLIGREGEPCEVRSKQRMGSSKPGSWKRLSKERDQMTRKKTRAQLEANSFHSIFMHTHSCSNRLLDPQMQAIMQQDDCTDFCKSSDEQPQNDPRRRLFDGGIFSSLSRNMLAIQSQRNYGLEWLWELVLGPYERREELTSTSASTWQHSFVPLAHTVSLRLP